MTDSFFPDISAWQPNLDCQALKASGYQMIGCRISYGTLVDAQVARGRVSIIREGNFTLIFWYLFLRKTQDIDAQVQTVINQVGSLRSNEHIVIDWENDIDFQTKKSLPAPTPQQRDQALNLFDSHYGKQTILYCASSNVPQNLDRPLWVASYGAKQRPNHDYVAWQYTDGTYSSAGYDPINFPVIGKKDASVVHSSIDDLATRLGSTCNQEINQSEGDDMPKWADEIQWPTGAKTQAFEDGTVKGFGADAFHGTMLDLKPKLKENFNPNPADTSKPYNPISAIIPKFVAPGQLFDPSQGYYLACSNGDLYGFPLSDDQKIS